MLDALRTSLAGLTTRGRCLLAAGVTLRWRWPRAAFVACAVGVGGFFAATTFFGPVLLALALTGCSVADRGGSGS